MMRSDVLVAGAGPAGMAAAAAAAECGMRVLVVDENEAAGGQIWRGYAQDHAAVEPHAARYALLRRRLLAANVQTLNSARVADAPARGVLRLENDTGTVDVRYERLVVATGARERFLPFPGWTLPGVMGVGGLQAMVKAGLPVAGKRVVLAGSGPLLLAVAAFLARRGALVAGIFEQAPLSRLLRFGVGLLIEPGKLIEGARYRAAALRVPYRTDSWVMRARGDGWIESVTVRTGNAAREIACDYLGCSFHLAPNLELPRLIGCAIEGNSVRVDADQRSSAPNVYCAGEVTGIGGLDKALVEGEIAGLAASGRSAVHLHRKRDRLARFAECMDAAFAPRAELRSLADPSTVVCRCEDVRRDALEGMRSGREAKLHTRCGMGACQGRVCSPATAFLFGWQSESVRPPLTPARIETLASETETPATASSGR